MKLIAQFNKVQNVQVLPTGVSQAGSDITQAS